MLFADDKQTLQRFNGDSSRGRPSRDQKAWILFPSLCDITASDSQRILQSPIVGRKRLRHHEGLAAHKRQRLEDIHGGHDACNNLNREINPIAC